MRFVARIDCCCLGLLLGVVGLGGGCTRVKEQPPAPIVTPPAPHAGGTAAANERRRAAQRTPWPRSPDESATVVPPPAPRAAAANDDQGGDVGLPRQKLQVILDAALPTLTSCWGAEKSLTTSIAFEATGAGRAENVRMPGASPESEKCVAQRLGALALPTYVGPVISIRIPVTVTQPATVAKAAPGAPAGTAAATSAEAAAPPKLFVNP